MANENRKGALYALFTASLWGFMAIILKVITYDIPPLTVVWFRFAIAFVILATWTVTFRRSDFSIFRRPPFLLLLAALFLAGNYSGFISGIKYISPSSSQVFIQIAPVSFALSGILIFREHVNWKHILGFVLVLSGMGLFYSEQLRDLTSKADHFTLGIMLVLGGGLSWAAFATAQKALLKKIGPNQLNLFVYGFCALVLMPLASFARLEGMAGVNWIILAYLGLNTVLAYGSLSMAIKFTEATRVSVIITLNPIITFLTMAILTRLQVSWIEPENFSIFSIFGALSVLGGAILVIYAGWKRKVISKPPLNREPRIHLEKISSEDFEAYYSLASNTEVMALITGRAMTRQEAGAKFEALLGHGCLHESYGSFKVTNQSDSKLLGFAKLEIRKGNRGEAELGYMLKPEFWGQGYGGEIAAYLMKKAEADPELTRVFAIIDPGNTASKRILLRLGFESEEKCDIGGWPSEILGRKMK